MGWNYRIAKRAVEPLIHHLGELRVGLLRGNLAIPWAGLPTQMKDVVG